MLGSCAHLQKSAPISFSLVAVNLDQKQPGFPEHILSGVSGAAGVECKIVEEENTYGIVKEKIRKEKPPARCVSPASRHPLS